VLFGNSKGNLFKKQESFFFYVAAANRTYTHMLMMPFNSNSNDEKRFIA
jgi:hypothetical protein